MTSALGMTQKELLDLSERITSGIDTWGHSFCGYLVRGESDLKTPKFVFTNRMMYFTIYKYIFFSVYKIFGKFRLSSSTFEVHAFVMSQFLRKSSNCMRLPFQIFLENLSCPFLKVLLLRISNEKKDIKNYVNFYIFVTLLYIKGITLRMKILK